MWFPFSSGHTRLSGTRSLTESGLEPGQEAVPSSCSGLYSTCSDLSAPRLCEIRAFVVGGRGIGFIGGSMGWSRLRYRYN